MTCPGHSDERSQPLKIAFYSAVPAIVTGVWMRPLHGPGVVSNVSGPGFWKVSGSPYGSSSRREVARIFYNICSGADARVPKQHVLLEGWIISGQHVTWN